MRGTIRTEFGTRSWGHIRCKAGGEVRAWVEAGTEAGVEAGADTGGGTGAWVEPGAGGKGPRARPWGRAGKRAKARREAVVVLEAGAEAGENKRRRSIYSRRSRSRSGSKPLKLLI